MDNILLRNPERIDTYIKSFARGNPELGGLLTQSLSYPVRFHQPNLKAILSARRHWGQTLKARFENRTNEWVMFYPNRALDMQIVAFRNWLTGCIHRREEWLNDQDSNGIPRKLSAIASLEEAAELTMGSPEVLIASSCNYDPEEPARYFEKEEKARRINTVMILPRKHRVVRLNTVLALMNEGTQMKNCLRTPYSATINKPYASRINQQYPRFAIYSIRNSHNQSLVTLEVDELSNELIQCEGSNGTFPVKHEKPIIEFLEARQLRLGPNNAETRLIKQDGKYHWIAPLDKNFVVKDDFTLSRSNSHIELPAVFLKSLTIQGSKIRHLGNLKEVHGNFTILDCDFVNSLRQLRYVGGTLDARNADIDHLGKLRHVGGDLIMRDFPNSMRSLKYVGGTIEIDGIVYENLEKAKAACEGMNIIRAAIINQDTQPT